MKKKPILFNFLLNQETELNKAALMLLYNVLFWPATPPHDARYVPNMSNNGKYIFFLVRAFHNIAAEGK